MKATYWESEELEQSAAPPNEKEESVNPPDSLTTLKELTLRLLREVQCIGEVQTITFENGVDFYDEVTRFEIDLIKRALLQTAGHQGRAARLLNLRVTTLNSKIKHYGISANGFSNGYRLFERSDNDTVQHA